MFERRKRRVRIDIDALRRKLCEIWGRIIFKPIQTLEVFKELKFDYYNTSDRENIYRYISEFQEEAESKWKEFDIEKLDEKVDEKINEKVKEKIYKKWLDYCKLNNIPFIVFEDGFAKCPKTYEDMRKWLEQIALKKVWSVPKALARLAHKNMHISGRKGNEKIPADQLLNRYIEFSKILPEPKSSKTLEYIEGQEDEILDDNEEDLLEFSEEDILDDSEEDLLDDLDLDFLDDDEEE